jgi:transcriptional regulator with XRE-family HTH domain
VANSEDIEIGGLVARLREERGLSQSQLARRVGTSRGRTARLETGPVSPTLPFLQRVVGAMGWELPSEAVGSVGREYGLLVQRAGVNLVEDLAAQDPGELWRRLASADSRIRAVRRLPRASTVRDWVGQAKDITAGAGERPCQGQGRRSQTRWSTRQPPALDPCGSRIRTTLSTVAAAM